MFEWLFGKQEDIDILSDIRGMDEQQSNKPEPKVRQEIDFRKFYVNAERTSIYYFSDPHDQYDNKGVRYYMYDMLTNHGSLYDIVVKEQEPLYLDQVKILQNCELMTKDDVRNAALIQEDNHNIRYQIFNSSYTNNVTFISGYYILDDKFLFFTEYSGGRFSTYNLVFSINLETEEVGHIDSREYVCQKFLSGDYSDIDVKVINREIFQEKYAYILTKNEVRLLKIKHDSYKEHIDSLLQYRSMINHVLQLKGVDLITELDTCEKLVMFDGMKTNYVDIAKYNFKNTTIDNEFKLYCIEYLKEKSK